MKEKREDMRVAKRDKRGETQERGLIGSKGAAMESKSVGGKRRAGQKEK